MNMANDTDRTRKTLYITGFNPKLTTKHLLEELFTQGGPVKDITLFDTHAYVLFDHEESVPYCLALFYEIELYGQKLIIKPRSRGTDAFYYRRYLGKVREKLMAEYMKIPPPELPPKQLPKQKQTRDKKQFKHTKRTKRNTSKGKNKIKRSK